MIRIVTDTLTGFPLETMRARHPGHSADCDFWGDLVPRR